MKQVIFLSGLEALWFIFTIGTICRFTLVIENLPKGDKLRCLFKVLRILLAFAILMVMWEHIIQQCG
jgi:hypothetical protein